MKSRASALVLGLLVIVPLGWQAGAASRPGPDERSLADTGTTVLYLLRHAEKMPPPYEEASPDPGLSREGRARAAQLADLLASESITRVFSTDYRRTLETARPLADRLGVEVEPYDPRNLQELAGRLRGRPGRHVVVGHSNTTPKLVALLGGDAGEPIDEAREFDRLYILVLGKTGEVTTMRLRYGEASGRE